MATTGLRAGFVYHERSDTYLGAIYYNDSLIWQQVAWKGFKLDALATEYAEGIMVGALSSLFDAWADG